MGVTCEFVSIPGVGGMSFIIDSFVMFAGIGGRGSDLVGMAVMVGPINMGLAWGS